MKKNGEFVGVDEKFIPENEKYVDESLLGDKENAKKVAKRFGIGYLAIMFVPIVIFIIMSFVMTSRFNNFGSRTNYHFEQYQGTQDGWEVRHILDNVVTHNKTNNYIVTVTYNGNTATSEDDLVAIKYQISDSSFEEYEVSIGYDKKGRANQITIRDTK